MSAQPRDDGRTGPDNQLDHFEIAARLEVDAAILDRFVTDHPNPTAPIVLGWAEADPAHREAVERWLAAREDRATDRTDDLLDEVDTEADTAYSVLKDGGRE